MTDQSPLNDRDDGPWYKQFWAWFVLAPLIIIMIVWIPFMTIVVKQADDTVIDNYYKEGRMINQKVDQDRQARELGLSGELFLDLDVGDIILTITATDPDYALPEELELHLDHPVEADNDMLITLRKSASGRYQAELQQRIYNRWYVRVLPPVENAEEEGSTHPDKSSAIAAEVWRITGEMDLSKGTRLTFGGDE